MRPTPFSQKSNAGFPKVLIVLFVCLGLGACYGGCSLIGGITYSDGERTGVITKFSKKGVFWKSWEGEMSLGGFRNGSDNNLQANVWNFSVIDDSLVATIQEAQRKNVPVTLHYRQVIASAPWQAGTDYLITNVVSESK
jgi:hypothetical protein